MWRLPFAALLLVGPGCSPATSETPAGHSMLFIGNSLTYTNDLPAMVEKVAEAAGESVVPVGIAWKSALDEDRDLPLYGGDGYHPAPAGTLLAALTIYDRLSGRDVRSIPSSALATIAGVPLAPARLEAMATAAHAASTELPTDPLEPILVDTTIVSASGGPC
jgi:hypothetical protein